MMDVVPNQGRRAMRRGVHLSCELVTGTSDQPLDYVVSDLSVDGLWVSTASPLANGEIVVVCMEPRIRNHWGREEDQTIHVFARVVRVAEPLPSATDHRSVGGMGLEMLDLTVYERNSLGRWLTEHGTALLN